MKQARVHASLELCRSSSQTTQDVIAESPRLSAPQPRHLIHLLFY